MLKTVSILLLSSQALFGATTTAPPEVPPPVMSQETVTPSYSVVPLKERANDFSQAFDILRREKTTARVFFQLANGSTIPSIIDMTVLSNGTMIVFRFNSDQGIKFQVVKVEDIVGISYY